MCAERLSQLRRVPSIRAFARSGVTIQNNNSNEINFQMHSFCTALCSGRLRSMHRVLTCRNHANCFLNIFDLLYVKLKRMLESSLETISEQLFVFLFSKYQNALAMLFPHCEQLSRHNQCIVKERCLRTVNGWLLSEDVIVIDPCVRTLMLLVLLTMFTVATLGVTGNE